MSNTSIMSVRDMIENAFGKAEVNTVNFKLIQAILYLLARQLRVLERKVGVEIGFVPADGDTESTLTVTEVNISATVQKKIKGRGVKLLNTVLTSTPRILPSTMSGLDGSKSVNERITRMSRVSAYDVETAKRRRSEKGERKSIRDSDRHRESLSRDSNGHREPLSRDSDRHRQSLSKHAEDENDISDQFDDSRLKGSGKSDKRASKKKEAGKGGAAVKPGSGKQVSGGKKGSDGAEKSGRIASSSSETSKIKNILNRIEEERERVLRIIKQRTDSKVDDSGSPTPIASMDSTEVQYEKLLILERVPSKESKAKTKKDAGHPRLSIVTQEQFDELVKQVILLEERFGKFGAGASENAKLMEDLHKGASFTDAMAALQLSARIEAAESALQNMIALLTELSKRAPPKGAKAGVPPYGEKAGVGKGQGGAQGLKGIEKGKLQGTESGIGAGMVQEDTEGAEPGKTISGKEIGVSDELADNESLTKVLYEGPDIESQGKPTAVKLTDKKAGDHVSPVPSDTSATATSVKQDGQLSGDDTKKYGTLITYEQLQDALRELYEEFNKTINTTTAKSALNAENAMKICKAVENKIDQSVNITDRMAVLENTVADYIEQINILDTGLSTQMTDYQEQLTQMQHELEIGLENMAEALASQGGESEAVTELNMRFTTLQADFDKTRTMQFELSDVQKLLELDLEALWKQIEQLRGKKSDRDEVTEALRDKAGIEILNGYVTLNQFDAVRGDLEKRIGSAYDKFNNQEIVWQKAIDDLIKEINEKAEYSQVIALRDDVNKNLDMLRGRIQNMLDLLGESRATVLAKTLYRDHACLSCATPAPLGLEEPNLAQLPSMKARPPTIGEEAPSKRKGEGDHDATLPCYPGQPIPHALDPRARVCARYCGSSVPQSTKMQKAPVNININTLIREPAAGAAATGKTGAMDEKIIRVPCTPCNTSAMLNAVKSLQQGEKPGNIQNETTLEKMEEAIENASMQPVFTEFSTN